MEHGDSWPGTVVIIRLLINKLADFKKLRMRATGTEFAALVKGLGATPVSMPILESSIKYFSKLISLFTIFLRIVCLLFSNLGPIIECTDSDPDLLPRLPVCQTPLAYPSPPIDGRS